MNIEPETPDLKWITLDCGQMESPEPMLQVLEQLNRLKQGEGIKMLHRMKPRLLFPKLQERGWNFLIIELTPDQVEVRIWKESMSKPAA